MCRKRQHIAESSFFLSSWAFIMLWSWGVVRGGEAAKSQTGFLQALPNLVGFALGKVEGNAGMLEGDLIKYKRALWHSS